MIWDELDEKIIINNRYIGVIHSSKLMTFPIEIPNIQRIRDDDKVNEIVEYQQLKLKQTGTCNFIGSINIHYCAENQDLYLVDGQHRFEAIKQISKSISIPVCVEIVKVDTIQELKDNYNMINKNTPLPEFPETIDKTIPERVANYYKARYPNIWSKSTRANRPNIYFNYFQEALGVLVDRMEIKTVQELQIILDEHNEKLSMVMRRDVSEKQIRKCAESGLYFGLYNHVSDEYRYDWVREILNIDKAVVQAPKAKRDIPKKIRSDAWKKYVGTDRGEAPCLCCRTIKITPFEFHAGHVISEANGGPTTVENIRPICVGCNLSMGTRDMREFVNTHYPKNLADFDTSTYVKKATAWTSIFGAK
jgi:5-methylcytosine-specific restriction endonuclease McrA